MKKDNHVEWSVVIFSSREKIDILKGATVAAARACLGKSAIIDIVVNGNGALAGVAADFVTTLQQTHSSIGFRVWSVPLGDKAYAWNQYLYHIAPQADIAFYIDGYAEVMEDAFSLIASSMRDEPTRLAATGVPSHGRSATKVRTRMLAQGGINGSLYALKATTINELRRIGFRLPVGIYRTDPLVGAVLCFNFRPDQNKWNPGRILVQPDATWRIPERKYTNIKDVRAYFRRRRRQALGLLVNAAVKKHLAVNRYPPEDLPEFGDELIVNWAKSSTREVFAVCVKNILCIQTLAVIAYRTRDFSDMYLPTRMIIETNVVEKSSSS